MDRPTFILPHMPTNGAQGAWLRGFVASAEESQTNSRADRQSFIRMVFRIETETSRSASCQAEVVVVCGEGQEGEVRVRKSSVCVCVTTSVR